MTGVGRADAVTVPSGFSVATIASGLSDPTAMEVAPDGRIFVAEQGGRLRVVKNGTLLATPFVSLSVDATGERGLLGVAFHPNFPATPYVYVYYTTATSPIHNRVSRFTANGDTAVANSGVNILDLDNLSTATNHNGGAIHFGPDGKLYVAVGENANSSNSQTLSNRLGKVLRINADGSIPSDNPFFNSAVGANRAIWALGLRNPFTFAFQRGSSRMFINDVGASTWEEINLGVAGSNYGWPITEGPTSDTRFRSPFHAYRHDGSPGGCAIAGGAFYNPTTAQFPAEFVGDYFFADLCGGWIRSLDVATKVAKSFASGISNPVDLKVGADGSLYYLERGAGRVVRIRTTNFHQWLLNNQNDTSSFDYRFIYGEVGDKVLACDWDGNSVSTPGIYRNGRWLLRNINTGGTPNIAFTFGTSTDVPVCGDWDGNGTDTPGIRRGATFMLRNSNSGGSADITFTLGEASDRPVVGNWDGVRGDGVGFVRGNAWYLTNRLNGTRDVVPFTYGSSADKPLAGDWDGNGTTTVGVRHGNTFQLRNSNTHGSANVSVTVGSSADIPLTGDWNSDRRSTIGLVRRY
jgi:glucose/arabinose dehydrogenase